MRSPSVSWTLKIAAGALAVGGAVAACFNEVPGPQGPLPSPTREVKPQGPTPGPILPTIHLAQTDDPASSSATAHAGIEPPPVPAADPTRFDVPPPAGPPPDASVPTPDSAADLPAEVPDAGVKVTTDAGVPMRR